MKIGIIGQGFVGNAVYQKFKDYYEVITYDLDKSKCNSTEEEVISNSDIIFVCLPTPMRRDNGGCWTGIVDATLNVINTYNKCKTVVVKSTIPPGTTKEWNSKYENINVVFNPEFLTEANAVNDYDNQNRIILGGDEDVTMNIAPIFWPVFPKADVILTDSTEAEMVKYLTNNFLSVKVAFANEMYDLCSTLNIDYDDVVGMATYDERLGKSHWSVPGPDGDFGFGGHCFPKDLAAILSVTKEHDTIDNVLRAAQATNHSVRRNKDWEKMEGRAVI
jgi:nucleotide sugar dehydrogenase